MSVFVIYSHFLNNQRYAQRIYMRLFRRSLRDTQNPFEVLSDQHFLDFYRFPKTLCLDLISELSPLMQHSYRRHAIPIHIKVLCALRFFATGSFQRCIGQDNMSAMSQTSVSRIVREVSNTLNRIAWKYIIFPKREEFSALKIKFMRLYHFPGVIGLIDGTHIKISAPRKEVEHVYYCRKGGHSKNLMIICDADLLILSASARFGGTAHDSYVWRQSLAYENLQSLYNAGERDFWLLGDSGYPLQPWLMTPFNTATTVAEERYNVAHKSTRVVVERCIGVLKSRFRCLSKERVLFYSPRVAGIIANACMVLHNYLIKAKIPFEDTEIVPEDHDNVAPTILIDVLPAARRQRLRIAESFI